MKLQYQNLTVEKAQALYINEGIILPQPYDIRRLDHKNIRRYYTLDKDNNAEFFLSVSSFIKFSMPTPKELIEWMVNYTPTAEAPNYKEYARQRASYGTFMHIQNSELLLKGKYNLNLLGKKLEAHMKADRIPLTLLAEWTEDLKKDLLSWAQFIQDYKVEPIAVEIILADPETGLAGAVDLICSMEITERGLFDTYKRNGKRSDGSTYQAGDPKEGTRQRRVIAILDEKSGRKSFYDDNALQLEGYRRLVKANYPELKVERLFNWSPKEWKGESPTYNLKDQTNNKMQRKFNPYLEVAHIEAEDKAQTMTITKNMVRLGGDLSKNIRIMNLSQVVKDVARRDKAEKKKEEIM